MLEEATNLENLEVFTPWGVSVGLVAGLEIESDEAAIENLFLEETNEKLVEDGASIMIPFRWVQSVGDIIILGHFPQEVPVRSNEEVGPGAYTY